MICFVVPGDPVAKGRARIARRGNHVMAYTPQKTRDYESLVAVCGKSAMVGASVLNGALRMSLQIHLRIPGSWSLKKKMAAISGEISPTKKPDLSNVTKGVEDGLNGIVYRDDSQITELIVTKKYSANPRVEVEISVVGVES